MAMSLARVLISTPCAKNKYGGRSTEFSRHPCSLPVPPLSRAKCVCRASTSCPLDTEAILARLRGSILLYDELVPLHGKHSIALNVWCAPTSSLRSVVLLHVGTTS